MQKSEERMKEICRYIEDYQFQYRRTPTLDSIADAVGTVKSNVYKYLAEMEQRHMISRTGREIKVCSAIASHPDLNRVPILGSISCGLPKYAEENIEEYIPMPVALFGTGNFFILRANGASMIEAGIDDGDLVLIRQQNYADPGQIVVALIDDEATLKRYYPEPKKRRICLHPENSKMKDIYVDYCIIQGVAINVLKDLE